MARSGTLTVPRLPPMVRGYEHIARVPAWIGEEVEGMTRVAQTGGRHAPRAMQVAVLTEQPEPHKRLPAAPSPAIGRRSLSSVQLGQ